MQEWKFVLFGITGDLSKKKILPGLAKFAEWKKDEVLVDLIGYSRSKPERAELEQILHENTPGGTHVLRSIQDIQGEYEDPAFIQKIVDDLKPEQRLVVYVAVPPHLFSRILQNFCFCAQSNIDILIEKPIGQNISDAQEMFRIIDSCKLFDSVHFIDHYLFKNALYLSSEQLEKVHLQTRKPLKSISVRALESLDVSGRQGYYDQNGAIKDFLPSHLTSLLDHAITLFRTEPVAPEKYEGIAIHSLELGQYDSYLHDIEKEISNTETYFKITGQVPLGETSITFELESGKKLKLQNPPKITEVTFLFEDTTTLTWNIIPERNMVLPDGSVLSLIGNDRSEHENMFSDVLNKNYSKFFIRKMVLAGWTLYDKTIAFKNEHSVVVRKYQGGSYPVIYTDSL